MSVKFEYIDSIYNSLSSMDVQLDPNPIEYGPGKLNRKVAEVRALLSKTEKPNFDLYFYLLLSLRF